MAARHRTATMVSPLSRWVPSEFLDERPTCSWWSRQQFRSTGRVIAWNPRELGVPACCHGAGRLLVGTDAWLAIWVRNYSEILGRAIPQIIFRSKFDLPAP